VPSGPPCLPWVGSRQPCGRMAEVQAWLQGVLQQDPWSTYIATASAASSKFTPDEWALLAVSVLPALSLFFALVFMSGRAVGLCCSGATKVAPAPAPAPPAQKPAKKGVAKSAAPAAAASNGAAKSGAPAAAARNAPPKRSATVPANALNGDRKKDAAPGSIGRGQSVKRVSAKGTAAYMA